MKTFVFTDRVDAGLLPLTGDTCAALLPVAGKAVVEYTIEDLARAGIREAVIVVSAHAERVEAHLGHGERWGMTFEYFPGRGGEHPAALLRRFASDLQDTLLLVRGDVMRSSIAGFIETATRQGGALTEARIGGAAVGVCLCRAGIDKLGALEWPYAAPACAGMPAGRIELQDSSWSALDSPAACHRTNLDVAAGRYAGIKPAGWARESGLMAAHGSQVSRSSLSGGHAFVGRGSRVHPAARLGGTSVVSDGCYIDSGANITDSLVLPGTYIGKDIEIRNAIVDGKRIIRIDSGASYRVTDRFLLAQMQHAGSSLPARLANRAAGLAVLLLSLPLWPVAAAGALLEAPSAPLRRFRLRSNRRRQDERHESVHREFTACEWAVAAPVLRRLPLLLAVVSGDLDLVGGRPRPPLAGQTGSTPWDRAAVDIPGGLLGPVQLDLPGDAPPEEGVLNEICYMQHRSLKSDLGYLLKGLRSLFSGRAWGAHGQVGNSQYQ